MKRFSLSCAAFAAASLLAFQPALAARIYNFLPVHVAIVGHVGYGTNVAPGQRSDSLAWPAALAVTVHSSGGPAQLPLCAIGFRGHAEIQGGNYMTIGHRGVDIICTVCDSNHAPLASGSGKVPASLFDLNQHPTSRTGC